MSIIYSAKAGQLVQDFETALREQSQAMKQLAAELATSGKFADNLAALEQIEFHDNRVMDIYAKLQNYRLDRD